MGCFDFTGIWCLLHALMLVGSVGANEPIMVESDDCPLGLDEEVVNKSVYIGWLAQISCNPLGFVLIDIYSDYYGMEAECLVTESDSGDVLLNETYILDSMFQNLTDVAYTFDVTEDSPTQYEVKFHFNGSCVSQIVELTIKVLPTIECKDIPENYKRIFPKDVGQETKLYCEPLDDTNLYFTEDDNVTYVWTRNCSDHLPDDAVQTGKYLQFYQTKFDDAGLYQCKVLYNGQSRYVVEHQLCVRFQSTQDQSLTMECPDVIEAALGHDVNITCLGDLGEGKANGVYLYSKWSKTDGNTTCENVITETVENGSDPRAQCLMHSILEDTCYYYNPHIDPPNDIIEVSLLMRNLEESDFGEYNVSFASNSNLQVSKVVRLERKRPVASHTAAIASALCIVVIFLIICFLVIYNWHDVLWCWKRQFGRHDLDSFSYMAYLAYYYDNNNKATKIDPATLIDLLENFIKKIGGKPFNPEKNVAPGQYDIENLCNVLKDCHRVIVVLTPEYVKDDLSILKVYKGFQKEIEEQRKIIFIHLPGADEAIENLGEAQKRTLKLAIKMNRSLSWKGQNPLERKFKRRLEYSLPKLRSHSYDRGISTSSDAKLTTTRGQVYSVSTPTSESSVELRIN